MPFSLRRTWGVKLRYHLKDCGGCRTCEIVCSFHHVSAFSPAVSSIRIIENETGGFDVVLMDESDGTRRACDLCVGLDCPLCVRYCAEAEGLKEILRQFASQRNSVRD